MSELAPRFSSNRMLREYLDGFYWPAAVAYRDRLRDGGFVPAELGLIAWYR
ncbi:hypothetical protein [Burkholderia sp. Bp9143]|uniref:hypothetical protein n=1 Tax=Burkholderia sp. Bp9143 TaxID=2184574 RepID=UPI0021AB3AC8|nr:hypothetical protein [Burkholderia sp. Bp9143]